VAGDSDFTVNPPNLVKGAVRIEGVAPTLAPTATAVMTASNTAAAANNFETSAALRTVGVAYEKAAQRLTEWLELQARNLRACAASYTKVDDEHRAKFDTMVRTTFGQK
jgi:hypothetical protein